MKVNKGADFIVTQLFYDVDNFLRWLQRIRSCGSYLRHRNVPTNTYPLYRHHRPSDSGCHAYSNICIVSSPHKALWNTCPRPHPCRSGVHQGIRPIVLHSSPIFPPALILS